MIQLQTVLYIFAECDDTAWAILGLAHLLMATLFKQHLQIHMKSTSTLPSFAQLSSGCAETGSGSLADCAISFRLSFCVAVGTQRSFPAMCGIQDGVQDGVQDGAQDGVQWGQPRNNKVSTNRERWHPHLLSFLQGVLKLEVAHWLIVPSFRLSLLCFCGNSALFSCSVDSKCGCLFCAMPQVHSETVVQNDLVQTK